VFLRRIQNPLNPNPSPPTRGGGGDSGTDSGESPDGTLSGVQGTKLSGGNDLPSLVLGRGRVWSGSPYGMGTLPDEEEHAGPR